MIETTYKRVIGVRLDNGNEFQSQTYETDEEKQRITELIIKDASDAGIEIEIQVSVD